MALNEIKVTGRQYNVYEDLAVAIDSDTDVLLFSVPVGGLDGNKTAAFYNSGANGAIVTIKGCYRDSGFSTTANEQFAILTDQTIASSANYEENLPPLNAYTSVGVYGRRQTAGQDTTLKAWVVTNK